MGRRPAQTFHPSFALLEECGARGWSQVELARRAGISVQYANDLLKARRGISARVAVALERAGLASAEFWMQMQASYDLGLFRELLRETRRAEQRMKHGV